MTLTAGSRLGPYEILAPLGAGGMGEVYKARDPRLSRLIAIKVLPAELASRGDRLRRFESEARAASALNHPAILTVYDVGSEGPVSYIAMEYVDGQTLHDLLQQGSPPVRKLLEIAAAIAEGLAAAHEAGIVHRDVKPANIMVSRQGLVKILDFGLAKVIHPEPDESDSDQTTQSTPGSMLGTVAYMSPEQARGSAVDFRTDQFSFGAVLYEMATCQRAFRGDTDADTLAAILRQEPEPIGSVAPHVPVPFRWVVERCLSKAAQDRYDSTQDLARELRNLRDHLSEISAGPRPGVGEERRRPRWPFAAAAAAGAIGLAVLAWRMMPTAPTAVDVDFRRLTSREGTVFRAQFVPHSNTILYTASWGGAPPRAYLTLPDSRSLDRSLDADAQLPLAYNQDGSEVLVLVGIARPSLRVFGPLAWWPALGGKPRVIADEGGWADVARRSGFLAVVRQEGNERTLEWWDAGRQRLRTLFRTTGAISYVRVSPDESQVAFIHHPSPLDDAGEVRVVPVDGGAPSRALSDVFQRCVGLDWDPRSGQVWFTATKENIYRTTLWASDLSGPVRPVYSFPEFLVLNDISDAGALLLVASSGGTGLQVQVPPAANRDLTWLGATVVTDVSPDGGSVLFVDGGPTDGSLGTWVRSLDGGEAVRIADGGPGRFSPDGKWVVTTSRPNAGPPQLILVPASGGDPRPVTRGSAAFSEPAFLDGRTLLALRAEGERTEVWRMALDGSEARPLGITNCLSPVADAGGRNVLCMAGPKRNALAVHSIQGGPARPLYDLPSPAGFLYARWNASGNEVLAVTNDGRLLALSAATGALLRTEVLPLTQGSGSSGLLRSVALGPDGRVRAFSTSHVSSRLYLCRGL